MSSAVYLSLLLVLSCHQRLASGSHVLGNPTDVGLTGWSANTTRAVMFQSSKEECDLVMNLSAADRCAFVKNTPDCSMEDGFISYLRVAFCLLPPNLTPLTIILCIIWLFFLFFILGLAASKFFCPNLSAISTSLHLTHNVAGVTFLALGNGAPDIFSAIAAISRPHTAGLAVGALFGAGVFVTTVVAGSVALVKPFTVASRPFLRDVIFYMAAVFWTFFMLFRGTMTLRETFGYLSLYVVYVLTVIISAYIYNRQKHSINSSVRHVAHIPVSAAEFHSSDSSDDDIPCLTGGPIQHEYESECVSESEYRPLLPYSESTSQILLSSLNPVDNRKWRRKSWRWRVLKMLKTPVEVLLLLCIPVVDPDKEDKNWRRPLNCLHLITAPLVCVLVFQSGMYGDYMIQGQFPIWLLTLLLGLFLSAIVFCTTTNDCPPKYHPLFAILGFVVSAVLISAVASEVVSLLHMLGVVLSLSNTVLGLTLLAWGNSIGDCFSDITIARQGYPRMAISACFGGIIFNMVFGVGLGCLVQMLKTHADVQFELEGLLTWVLAGSLGLSLVLSFVIIPLCRFHLGRAYGIFLLFFYATFLVIALLTEFGKIHSV
ncbi:mitochondrial sodium/calcium exchanger protein [Chelmon rostratus]|uniref:mitochondrial sodium/calcium exchanger protein n=1 Tax=Chelmon rostratus TaxID=109905 RepID=UPI001BEAE4E1|nr:mitochondrial sodium/calcium exchanger protein [Chelmon rostratus]XP_041793268.1 mitochondrial sodium/calcium exchanger protein [Chelmon rostratus]